MSSWNSCAPALLKQLIKMDDYQRLKILLYQYTMFKGDFYQNNAKEATERLQRKKILSSDECYSIIRDLLMNELFDTIQRDILNLLDP